MAGEERRQGMSFFMGMGIVCGIIATFAEDVRLGSGVEVLCLSIIVIL